MKVSTVPSDAAAGLHRIVIVGGGAGGLELATRLGHTLGKRGRAHVTLIEKARTRAQGSGDNLSLVVVKLEPLEG